MNFFSTHHLPTGQIILWSLLVCSIVLVAVALERCWFWLVELRGINRQWVASLSFVATKGIQELKQFSAQSNHPITLLLKELTVDNKTSTFLQVKSKVEELVARSESGIRILGTIYALAPVFGILGTVTGIIQSFEVFTQDTISPEMIMPGISEALITTAVGLLIAIPSLIAHQIFSSLSDRLACGWEQFLFALSQQLDITHSLNVDRE